MKTKQIPRLSEMTTEEKKAYDKKARDCRADLHAKHLASAHKDRKTSQGGKAPDKQLVTKAARKVVQLQLQPNHVIVGCFSPSEKLNVSSAVLIC